jgi:uncharacterized membrane protein YsdA (DUF1294 family)
MVTIILPILIILNLAAFLTYGIDKAKARHGTWRISDRTLLTIALVAGFGAFAGMRLFHHKTRQPAFRLAAFVGMVINGAVLFWLYL